ncbi:MAG TPA: flavohemoglobin expression-modulating QEGLA motif protein [Polyangium sp.]|nr:flavohemoglobin expression-modulating QEGLA motif protein [Polyangium sp.]
MTSEQTALEDIISRVDQALGGKKGGKLLAEIAWPRKVEEEFFRRGEDELPKITYAVDRDGVEERIAGLAAVEKSLRGDAPVIFWLRATVKSHIDGNRLMLAVGTKAFHHLSREIYGSARSSFYGYPLRNVDLADHLFTRLKTYGWDAATDPETQPISAKELQEILSARIAARRPHMQVEVLIDDGITAKVIAGMSRVRIRPDATFALWEAEGLYHHEIETHALTAHNGARQKRATFLRSGGPRTTRTQEGLAMFSELYNRALSIDRIERLALRVKLVDMAEQGASFLDLYRFLVGRGSAKRDAYFDAQRVCRGGLVQGCAPYTKDACYLAGMLEVYTFLSAITRGGFRDELELLVCGRIHLDDITALARLRSMGLLERPAYLPGWLEHWRTLLPYFAFTSFLAGIDMAPVEAHYSELIRTAEAAKPPA